MDSINEINSQLDEDYIPDIIPRKRVEDKVGPNRAAEIVYKFLGNRRCDLLYMGANNLISEYLLKGKHPWDAESKLTSIINWGIEKHAHPLAVLKVINKEIKKIGV
jgi:hypothetical protein